jgi:hypothetical protein
MCPIPKDKFADSLIDYLLDRIGPQYEGGGLSPTSTIIQLQGKKSAITNIPTTGETDPIATPTAQTNQESRG